MKDTSHHDDTFTKMTFASVYPHYITKIEKKGRSKDELHQLIKWLTGYSDKRLEKLIKDCLLYTSPSPRDQRGSRMPSSA